MRGVGGTTIRVLGWAHAGRKGFVLGLVHLVACAHPGSSQTLFKSLSEQLGRVEISKAQVCAPRPLGQLQAYLQLGERFLKRADAYQGWLYSQRAQEQWQQLQQQMGQHPCCNGKGTDADHDGITDALDTCPKEPEDKDGFMDGDGCPEGDNDNDTVLDGQDRCPLEPGEPSFQGCPRRDRDGDGISDHLDLCPDVAETLDGIADHDGCSEEGIGDQDSDGIPNHADACPTLPEDRDGFDDQDGCPDPDNDLDGVLDLADACPLEPGLPEQQGCRVQDQDGDKIVDGADQCPTLPGPEPTGCPTKVLVKKTAEKIEIAEQIHFASGKAIIQRKGLSYTILEQVAAVLKAYPTLHIIIEGHTDNMGKVAANTLLSQKRAMAIRTALIGYGIAPHRMQALGLGPQRPILSNKTAKGRAGNRRVEFVIVDPASQAVDQGKAPLPALSQDPP